MHTIDYIKQLKDAKFNDEQITAIATIVTDIEEKQKTHLVTNEKLDKTIAELKFELIKWIAGTGFATILAIAGLLKYMIH
ncbi:MAG TPA: hypothetical protein PLP75_04285 [Burkholderiales bacterium]|nr:hypothetical protein [Burkholderiales bacterium]